MRIDFKVSFLLSLGINLTETGTFPIIRNMKMQFGQATYYLAEFSPQVRLNFLSSSAYVLYTVSKYQ